MKITHPFAGIHKSLELSEQVTAYVASIRKDLPTVARGDRTKTYWKEHQIGLKGKPLGLVPAGNYTDPSTKEAQAAVVGLYKALKGTPISRHKVAVALNFQVSDDVDTVRDALKEAGVKDVDPGAKGRSVRWVGEGAVAPEPKAKKVAGDKTPAKAATKTATKAPAKAPVGSRPAKRAAAEAAKTEAPAEPTVEAPAEAAPVTEDTPIPAAS
jgi:hypothetical protein